MKTHSERKRSPRTAGRPPQLDGVSVIPWTSILGDGERPLAERTHRDGQGLVVLLGPMDTLIFDLPEPLEALPEQGETIREPLVTLPIGSGPRPLS